MDFFSHALLPYLLGSYLGLEKRLLAALVLGGIAPDLDVLISWINNIYPTSLLLVHRGITHTLFFGFFFGLLIFYLFSRDRIKSFLSRFIKFDLDFSLYSLAFVYAGVLLHLFVDYTTTRGVPLFYPWEAVRYSANIFSQIEPIALIASLLVLAELIRERSRIKFNKNLLIIFMLFFLIMGGIRIEGKASAESFFNGQNAEIYPDSNLFSWAVLENNSDQFLVYKYDSLIGKVTNSSVFNRLTVASSITQAQIAIDAAENLPQVKLFRWRAYAVAINATSQNGSWIIEYYDPLVKAQMVNSGPFFRPALKGYGSVQVKVENGVARIDD
ncbi:MAG TPA: metal-dependent hydrolase [Methanothrix sp.]|nr:metal-dependent hydrolase [Methanothrix sp.]